MNTSNVMTLQLSPLNTENAGHPSNDCNETWCVTLSGICSEYVAILNGEMAGCRTVESPEQAYDCQSSQRCINFSCKTVTCAWEMDIEKVHPDQIGLPISGKVSALLQRLLRLGYKLESQSQVSIGSCLHGTWSFVKEESNFQ